MNEPRLTVIVPAKNEAPNLPICLRTLHTTLAQVAYEVLIIDDGSTDDTQTIARTLAGAQPDRVRVLVHEKNQGLGAALRTGFAAANAPYLMCCPADFAMAPEDWAPFAAQLGKADVLVGCRQRREGYNLLMRLNAKVYVNLVRFLFGLKLRDVNWICIYPREYVRQVDITQKGIPMLVEILVKLRDLGATFLEVDCRMQVRERGVPSAARYIVMWRTLTGLFKLWWNYAPKK